MIFTLLQPKKVGKMRLVLRQMKHIARASVILNVVVILFFSVDFLVTRVRMTESSSGKKDGNIAEVARSNDGEAKQSQQENTFKESCSSPKKVLMFGMKQHWLQFCNFEGMEHFQYLVNFPREIKCPGLPCSVHLRYSEDPKDLKGADIVTFSNVYPWLSPQMWDWAQSNRTKKQSWVMISLDSPLYVPGFRPPDKYNELTYNMFATYKLDSDVYLPYGFYQKYDSAQQVDLSQFWKPKDRMIAWISSNCDTIQWDRLKFVNDMKGVIQVDKYGSCGESIIPWNDDKAMRSALLRYKFYLSLENSCCDDYITEKFWRALDVGVVPIVVGASYDQYLKIAPPHSFIHVDQFESLQDLSSHLQFLAGDENQYLAYFNWRKSGKIVTHSLEEQYVTPLMNSTYCGILDKYLKTTEETRNKFLNYQDAQWIGSCRDCGVKWVKSYMKHQ